MHIFDKNPFYLKFLTSIEGYIHLFLSPILIYYITNDIKTSGMFFLIEGLIRFTAYSLSGGFINPHNIHNVIKITYAIRFIAVISALLIFFFVETNKFNLMIFNNFFFIISNCFYVTSLETLFQSHELFDQKVQSKITLADLLSGGLSVIIILLFTFFKISYIWLLPICFICFLGGTWILKKLIAKLDKVSLGEWRRIFKNSLKEFSVTIKQICSSKELINNMIIGYIPSSFFLMIEQVNIYRFSESHTDLSMKIMHYGFKSIWFLSGALFIPLIIKKSSELKNILNFSLALFLVGGLLSLSPLSYLNLLGALFLGYAYHLIFAYRKIRRKEILKSQSFQPLGVFFAVEGLSGVICFSYVSLFGKDFYALLGYFIAALGYLIYYKHQSQNIKSMV